MHHLSFEKKDYFYRVLLDGAEIGTAPFVALPNTPAAELRVNIQPDGEGFLVGDEIFLLSPRDTLGVFLNQKEVASVPLDAVTGEGAFSFQQLGAKSTRVNEGFRSALDRITQIAERAGVREGAQDFVVPAAETIGAFVSNYEAVLLARVPEEAHNVRARLAEAFQKMRALGLFDVAALSGKERITDREMFASRAQLFEIFADVIDGPRHEAVAKYPHRGELSAILRHAPQLLDAHTQSAVVELQREYDAELKAVEIPEFNYERVREAHAAAPARQKKDAFAQTTEVRMVRDRGEGELDHGMKK